MLPAVEPMEKLLNAFPVSSQQAESPGRDEMAGATRGCGAAGGKGVRREAAGERSGTGEEGRAERDQAGSRAYRAAEDLALVIASEAKQSRNHKEGAGLLRRLRLLAMTEKNNREQENARVDAGCGKSRGEVV